MASLLAFARGETIIRPRVLHHRADHDAHGRTRSKEVFPMAALLVIGEDPLSLDGSIDSSNDLQLKHGSDSLADYSQTLHAKHADLRSPPNGTIRIKLMDFTHGGFTWQMNASHNSGSVSWTRSTDHAYCDFGAMSSELQVDTSATSNDSPPVTKTRTVWIKTMPADGQ
jgi:hypothetical protein